MRAEVADVSDALLSSVFYCPRPLNLFVCFCVVALSQSFPPFRGTSLSPRVVLFFVFLLVSFLGGG